MQIALYLPAAYGATWLRWPDSHRITPLAKITYCFHTACEGAAVIIVFYRVTFVYGSSKSGAGWDLPPHDQCKISLHLVERWAGTI